MGRTSGRWIDQIELRISAEPKYLAVSRLVVRQVAEMAGLSCQDSEKLALAIDEAMTNVIRHSYDGPCARTIILNVSSLPGPSAEAAGLVFLVRDFGRQVDPETIKSRDLNDIRPGGRLIGCCGPDTMIADDGVWAISRSSDRTGGGAPLSSSCPGPRTIGASRTETPGIRFRASLLARKHGLASPLHQPGDHGRNRLVRK